mmetsp:Transcript_2701/g.5689  ORF Transcript_2701/g.5689 Transcript_2701/m.5689 type:complete len:310 (+) Transcript_2701:2542-3471(+)
MSVIGKEFKRKGNGMIVATVAIAIHHHVSRGAHPQHLRDIDHGTHVQQTNVPSLRLILAQQRPHAIHGRGCFRPQLLGVGPPGPQRGGIVTTGNGIRFGQHATSRLVGPNVHKDNGRHPAPLLKIIAVHSFQPKVQLANLLFGRNVSGNVVDAKLPHQEFPVVAVIGQWRCGSSAAMVGIQKVIEKERIEIRSGGPLSHVSNVKLEEVVIIVWLLFFRFFFLVMPVVELVAVSTSERIGLGVEGATGTGVCGTGSSHDGRHNVMLLLILLLILRLLLPFIVGRQFVHDGKRLAPRKSRTACQFIHHDRH